MPSFSIKEALLHGWEMTKKHWIIILCFMFVYVVFNVAEGLIKAQAGKDRMQRIEVTRVFKDSTQADKFYQYLAENGYIDKNGKVLEKLQRVSRAKDLELPPDFEARRYSIYHFLDNYRYHLPVPKSMYFFVLLGFWVINTIMSIGFVKSYLMISRNEEPALSEFFTNWNLFIPYCLGGLCYFLVVLGGFILLIIPGIIFMTMFQFWFYLIVDKGLGPIAAIKRSKVITKGQVMNLLGFWLMVLLINLAGLICFIIGLFVTISISSIASAHIYDRLENPPAAG